MKTITLLSSIGEELEIQVSDKSFNDIILTFKEQEQNKEHVALDVACNGYDEYEICQWISCETWVDKEEGIELAKGGYVCDKHYDNQAIVLK